MPTNAIYVKLKPRETIGGTSIGGGGGGGVSYLSSLLDVDVSGKANNYVLVYNSVTNKFEAQPIQLINGGSF